MASDNIKRESQKKRRKRIALDFDGVLHGYSKKWHDGSIYDPPVENAVAAIRLLAEKYDLIVFTCREQCEDIEAWCLSTFGIYIKATNGKPHADMYIDDRGYHFTGNWIDALNEIDRRADEDFAQWNHKGKELVETFKREDGKVDKWS